MTWPEIVDLVCKVLRNLVVLAGSVAALFGSIAAWRGVSAWRKQLIGQDAYNLAKRLLTSIFQLEKAIKRFRSPSGPLLDLTEVDTIGAELDSLFLEAQVQWKPEFLAEAKKGLVACTNELRLQVSMFEELSERNRGDQEQEVFKEANRVRYGRVDGKHDDFSAKVEKTVLALAEKLRPHLKI